MNDYNKYAFRIRTAMQKTQREIAMKMQTQYKTKLTRVQFHLLQLISEEEPCKVTDIAKRFGANPSTVSTVVTRLVHEGLITREYGNNDRRNVFVSITPQGRDVLEEDLHNYSRVLEHYLSHLEPSELETFILTFEKLASVK